MPSPDLIQHQVLQDRPGVLLRNAEIDWFRVKASSGESILSKDGVNKLLPKHCHCKFLCDSVLVRFQNFCIIRGCYVSQPIDQRFAVSIRE
jgi:hypothetical protein